MNSSCYSKADWRARLLLARRELGKHVIVAQSDKMAEQLFIWPYYQRAKVIMLFLPMPDEPQMAKIIEDCWKQGKIVCVPHMREQFGIMDAASIESFNDLVKGRFNLSVPNPASLKIIDPTLIDLILVPGVGFDLSGNRLGMGAGYYDRFIPKAPQAILVGTVLSSHIIENIPQDKYDRPVHYLLTENKIIKCGSFNTSLNRGI